MQLTAALWGVPHAQPPRWAAILRAAEEWGVPPWVVEAECPPYWWARWMVWRREQAKAARRRGA